MILFFKLTGLIILVLAMVIFFLWNQYSPQSIVRHIAQAPEQGALYLVKNGVVLLEKNPDQKLALASTVKLIVALEFAKQAAAKQVDPFESIPLEDLETYHLKDTDGGAHPDWLNSLSKEEKTSQAVSLSEVVRGMLRFSSNANTEYLMDKLGFDQVNHLLKQLDLDKHEELYPFVSSLLVLRDHSDQELEHMTQAEYIRLSHNVHQQLKLGSIDKKITQKQVAPIGLNRFSTWFTKATAREYGSILRKLNHRDYFSPQEYQIISEVIDLPDAPPEVLYGAEKGGSTQSILNAALYETHKNGDEIELVVFLNHLSPLQRLVYSITVNKLKLDLIQGKNLDLYAQLLQ